MTFFIDERITSTCFELGNWPLSRVFLKDNAHFPWLILVPRYPDITEINELPKADAYQLMDEINALSTIMRKQFNPDKLNVGALGNIVSQLHVHVVGRFKTDLLWPHGIWQSEQPSIMYPYEMRESLISQLSQAIQLCLLE
jgi:diadenosine tetraphosphate (Ap4A) HIT family hydrolase